MKCTTWEWLRVTTVLLFMAKAVPAMVVPNATLLEKLLEKYMDEDGEWWTAKQRGKRAITDNDMQSILDLHNKLRSQVYPTASNMEYMLSSICRAAVHAGVVRNHGGYVDVMPVDRRKAYTASFQNGIFSERILQEERLSEYLLLCETEHLEEEREDYPRCHISEVYKTVTLLYRRSQLFSAAPILPPPKKNAKCI
ncbi:Cysteine-rich secretory protein LCCL domain-containing 1 [Myotis davidii]|uniref:Cysteine-rich secretory protein LCCL domain-containing 1 n=1 Tax=Myotis davidii TaxID=225400 RepID=L5LN74_MYODS|nr:Cysteine-rich secretory protein LCCL domain-containing 1 [Myotis davidii]